jgi:iron complex transport system substrate-binding protein
MCAKAQGGVLFPLNGIHRLVGAAPNVLRTGSVALLILLSISYSCYGAPVTFVDDLGRPVVFSHPPQRIVSLEPSVTEILYAVGAGSKIVADDEFSDYPPAARQKQHVNGMGPGREMLIGLHPDLIVLSDQTFTVAKADQWQAQYGVPLVVLAAATYGGVESDIRRMGALFGDKSDTNTVIHSMIRALITVQKAVSQRPKPKVFVVVWDRPLMTAGRGSYIDNLITLAGGVNVAAKTAVGYPTYSPERLVADAPDIILTSTEGMTVVRQLSPGLTTLNLSANRLGKSFAIPDDWTARPGPRLALGLCAIARVLHPDAFVTRH